MSAVRKPEVLSRELGLIKFLTGWGAATAWRHFHRGEFSEAQQRIDHIWRGIYTGQIPVRGPSGQRE